MDVSGILAGRRLLVLARAAPFGRLPSYQTPVSHECKLWRQEVIIYLWAVAAVETSSSHACRHAFFLPGSRLFPLYGYGQHSRATTVSAASLAGFRHCNVFNFEHTSVWANTLLGLFMASGSATAIPVMIYLLPSSTICPPSSLFCYGTCSFPVNRTHQCHI